MIVLPSGHISSAEDTKQPIPFLRLAFRPLFWFGALFSVLSIGVWGLSLTGYIEFSPFGGSFFWHTHEMLFGFTVAIIAGFLLTAVQTWTGVPSIKGITLGILVFVWLSARILFAFPFSIPDYFITLLDLAFLPLTALFLAIPIVKGKNWRNLFFVPVLLVMATLNGLMHLSTQGIISISFVTVSHVMVLIIALIMCIMAGRVFPMFTANGTQTKRVDSLAWLEKLSVISVAASVLVTSQLLPLPSFIEASIYLIAGIFNLLRALRWRIWVTLKTPLVWSLHLSYWAVCVGLMMLGLEKLDLLDSASLAFHAITVGGAGLMIISMISRVSLGHTGRKIQVGKIMTLAFVFMVLTFIARVLAPLIVDSYNILILFACVLWVLAYGAFVVIFSPMLFFPRADGAKG